MYQDFVLECLKCFLSLGLPVPPPPKKKLDPDPNAQKIRIRSPHIRDFGSHNRGWEIHP